MKPKLVAETPDIDRAFAALAIEVINMLMGGSGDVYEKCVEFVDAAEADLSSERGGKLQSISFEPWRGSYADQRINSIIFPILGMVQSLLRHRDPFRLDYEIKLEVLVHSLAVINADLCACGIDPTTMRAVKSKRELRAFLRRHRSKRRRSKS